MKISYRSLFCFLIVCLSIQAKAQDRQLIDSLQSHIKPGTSDSMQLEIELQIVNEYLFTDAAMCLDHAQRALILAYKTGEMWVVPYLHDYIGMCYDDLAQYDEALIAYAQAIELTEELMEEDTAFTTEYERDLVVFLNNAGYTEFNRGNSADALDYYVRALDIARNCASEDICEVYASIAELYLEKKDFANAHRYAELASVSAPDSAWVWYEASLKGSIYLAEGKVDTALGLFERAVASDLSEVSNYDKAIAFSGCAEARLASGDVAGGLNMADSALVYARSLGNRIYEAEAHVLRSRAFFEGGDHDLARMELELGIELATTTGSLLHLADYLSERARQQAALGDYASAYRAKLASASLDDSIRSGIGSAEITEMLSSHEARRAAGEASELQAQLELGRIRERNTRRFALAMFICTLLLAVTTYIVIRRRRTISFSLSPITRQFDEDDKIIFMQRMTISLAVLLIPLVIYNAIWLDFERGVWAFGMLLFVIFIHVLIRIYKFDIALLLIIVSYPLIVFAPGGSASLINILWIPAAFMILSYATDSLRMQVLNGLFATSAFVFFLYRFNIAGTAARDLVMQPEAEVIVGIMALGAMFFALYYHRGRMFDYRFGLDKTSAFLRLMADANPNFVFAKDRDRKYTFANKAMSDAYGLPLSSILGHRPEEVNETFSEDEHFRKDDVEVMESGVDKLIPEEQVYNADGSVKWLRTLKKPIRNSDGEVVGVMGIATDITEMREYQRELKESLSLLEATIDSTADGLLVVDNEMNIVLVNEKFTNIWGESVVTIDKDGRRRLGMAAEQLKDPGSFRSQVEEIMASPGIVTEDTLEFKDGRIIERYSQPQKVGDSVVGRVWSFRDVTERENAIRDLVRSEERYRTSLEDNLFSIVRVRDGKFLSINKAFSDLTGYSEEELKSLGLDDVVHHKDLEHFSGFAEDVISGRQPTGNLECRIVRKDGGIRYILASVKGYYDESGSYLEATVTAADITQLKEVETALAESEARYRSLVEASPYGILLTDMHGKITFASRRFLEMTGLNLDGSNSPIGMNMLEFAEPEEYERAERDLAGALASSGPAFARYWVRIANGERLRVELGTRLIRDVQENPVGVIAVVRDITEKAKAEEVLRASELRYRVLFENTFDGFLILDKQGAIEDVNKSAVDLLDYPTAEVLKSKNIAELFPELTSDESFKGLLNGNLQRTLPIRTVGKDFMANQIYAEINLSLVPMQSGEKIACAIKDIAERVVLETKERELESQEAQLDALNRQLASLSIFNSQKMKLLSEIQADIDEARRNASSKVQGVLQRVGRKIEANLNEQEDMMAFKIQFEKIHPDFFKKLTEQCPKLTSHDLKYCAYIRLNMTTQDIANLLYVEKKSVEMSKYRIKKKLGLKKGERLSEFLHAI